VIRVPDQTDARYLSPYRIRERYRYLATPADRQASPVPAYRAAASADLNFQNDYAVFLQAQRHLVSRSSRAPEQNDTPFKLALTEDLNYSSVGSRGSCQAWEVEAHAAAEKSAKIYWSSRILV
jgi:hypothetical protein